MKKVCALLALIVGLLLLTGSAVAQAKPAEKGKAAEQKAAKTEAATQLKATGQIVSVDATAKTLVVKSKGKELTFLATDKVAATLAGFKAGQKVSVRYVEEDGKLMAHSVHEVKVEAENKPEPKQ